MASPRRAPWPREGFSIAALPRDLFAGAIAALVTIAYAVSFSALIFAGPLEPGAPFGFAALLTGAAVTGAIVGLGTGLVPADAGPDTPAVAVMSVLAAAVAARLPAGIAPDSAVLQVLVAITVATLLAGLLLFALGALRAGIWLRFIPYPVIGGFLAASGWLLITGGIEVSIGNGAIWAALGSPGADARSAQLAVGLGLAGVILALRRWVRGFVLLPAVFFLGVVGLDLALVALDHLSGGLDMSGWYLQTAGERVVWWPLGAIPGAEVHWVALARQGVEIAAVCGVTAIALLLDVSSLEVARGRAADLDHELRVNGLANIVAAPLGGVAGNLSMVGSLLIGEAGAASRASTLCAAAVCAAAIFLGHRILAVVPTPLLGGILIYLGVSILYAALIESATRRSLADNVLAVAITVAIALFGYLIGILLGILGACLSFAFSYSRISIIGQHLSRANFRSNVDHSPEQMRLLAEKGEAIQILWLRGYIFFGTSNTLFEYVRTLAWAGKSSPVRYVILDFQQVPGFDSSAVFSLIKLRNACHDHDVTLTLSGLSGHMHRALEGAGFFAGAAGGAVRAFAHRDGALQWCEDELLRIHGAAEARDAQFRSWLGRQLGRGVDTERIVAHLERIEIEPGDYVVRQGGVSDSIDLIAAGRVVVAFEDESGRTARLRHMVGQTVVGEMGFFRKARRAASVVAEEPTVVYRMRRTAFDRLAREDPAAAAAFHGFIIRLLSDRLEFANREIAALQEPMRGGPEEDKADANARPRATPARR